MKNTLKEAAKKYCESDKFESSHGHGMVEVRQSFIDGIKWQEKRSYSEEEVRKLLDTQRGNCYVAIYNHTKDTQLSLIANNAPEPSGKNG